MSHMVYFPEWFTDFHLWSSQGTGTLGRRNSPASERLLREPELSTREPIIEQQKEEKVGEISPP